MNENDSQGRGLQSPYDGLEPRAFWRSGVALRAALQPGDLYRPKFVIDKKSKIMTAGSCFAQHIGRTLKEIGFTIIDRERLPDHVPDDLARRYGYRMYSARYGNIYTAAQLRQIIEEAILGRQLTEQPWEANGRWIDPFRPNVEPNGFETANEVQAHRVSHINQVRYALKSADILIFTFGLTESWMSSASNEVFPVAPGVIGGEFDNKQYCFKNFNFDEIIEDFSFVRRELKKINANIRFLVTVSPVPLTATASGQHVEVATSYSKSTLRAVCGVLQERYSDVDYFPSYELITSQNARGVYFEANMRSVSSLGVSAAMKLFVESHALNEYDTQTSFAASAASRGREGAEDLVCEEVLLEAFSKDRER